MKKNFIIILLLILFFIIFSGGVCLYFKNHLRFNNIVAPEDNLEWKTYRNDYYGYEIKYPKDWILNNENKERITLNNQENEKVEAGVYNEGYMEDIIINYYSSISEELENKLNNFGATTLDELVAKNRFYGSPNKIIFAGKDAYELIAGGFGAYYSILIEKNSHLYTITFGNRSKKIALTEIDKEILNSFKFIETKPTETNCGKGPLPSEISGNPEFKKYISELIRANPGLKIGEFECITKQIGPFWSKSGLTKPKTMWAFSPDSKKAITTLIYLGEPDCDLTIYNRNDDEKEETLGSCGTPCYWLNAFWLNNERFITIFSSEYFRADKKCDAPDGVCYTYRFELYDLSKNTLIYYYFPELFYSHLKNPWRQEQCERVFGAESSYCK